MLINSAADRASRTDSPFEAAGVREDANVFESKTSLYRSVSLSARDLMSVHAYRVSSQHMLCHSLDLFKVIDESAVPRILSTNR